jgi:hypothetical protein
MTIHQVFLDWSEPALPSTATYLQSHYAVDGILDLRQVILALPGGHAGRRLLEILVDLAETHQLALIPPQIITIGQLPELLYDTQRLFANTLTQQLAWIAALYQIEPSELECLTRHLPDEHDFFAHLTLVERLMALHRDLAGNRLRFSDVTTGDQVSLSPHETSRWHVLSTIQSHYVEKLDELDLWEPQLARLWAINEGACRSEHDIILVGAIDLNATQRAIIDQIADRVTTLVFAPSAIADRFDAYGCVRHDAWLEADIELDPAHLVFSDNPSDQANEMVQVLTRLNEQFAADDITIGVPDPTLVPHIQQRLEDHQLPFRYGVGTPVTHSSPYRLLRSAADCLESQSFTAFSNLARHPAIDAWLSTQGITRSWLEELDGYYCAHLPARLTGRWLADRLPRTQLRRAFTAIERLLKPLRGTSRHPQQWTDPILDFLIQVYEDVPLSREDDADRTTLAVCEALQVALRDSFQVPDAMAPHISGAAAMRLLLRAVQDVTIPPRVDQSAIELLGWLELPLDDAPVVIVTGFNEGFVPESQNGDLFLPDMLRTQLGLPDNASRYARDAYNLSLLAAPRSSLTLIVGRRTLDNDILLPSRLLFACDDNRLLERTHTAFSSPEHRQPKPVFTTTLKPGRSEADLGHPQPTPLLAAIASMRVTEFRDYLTCPFRYYLKHHLNLQAVNTTDEEMGPPAFGNLLHHVLQEFADSAVAQSERVTDIRDLLYSALDHLVLKSFGADPLPAVRIQAEQARSRLERFAAWQADWRRQGWRIEHAETGVNGENAWIEVDGEPMYLRGRIDRIDIHETTQERIVFDYKTGDTARQPDAVHRNRQSDWTDLQLPLYRHLVKGLGLSDHIQLGYIMLPKALGEIGASVAAWSSEDLAHADRVAFDVVRQVRAEQFWPPSILPPDYDDFAVLCRATQLTATDTATLASEA